MHGELQRPGSGGVSVTDYNLKITVFETTTEWILALDSPEGSTSVRVPSPFTSEELTGLLHQLETSLVRSYSKAVTRRTVSPDSIALQFGSRLVDVLLKGDSLIAFEQCRRAARESGGQVRVLIETNGAAVSRIPWEFAVDPKIKDDYLALRVALARHLRVSTPVPPLTVTPPLRVLAVNAHPRNLPALDAAREQESLAFLSSLSSELVDVHWLPGDRWSDLSDALSEGGWHVLHFVGHGGFDQDSGSGFLVLSDEQGDALPVPATRIGAAAASSGDLRLVVVNACDSATTGAAGAFSSTAAKLMREGIPAVVAMQYEITDTAALAFAAGFYEALARGKPVDQAVTKAREILSVTQNSLEWATPVLFLASDETRLFDIATPSAPACRGEPVAAGARSTADRGLGARVLAATGAHTGPDRVGRDLEVRTRRPPHHSARRPGPEGSGGRCTESTHAANRAGRRHYQSRPVAAPVAAPAPAPAAPHLDPDLPQITRLAGTSPLADCRRAALGPKNLLAMACRDGSVRAWDVAEARWAAHCQLQQGVQPVTLAWTPWPRHVASANDDGTIVVWDLQLEVPLRLIRPECSKVASMAFSDSGRWLAVVGGDRTVEVFDAQGRQRLRLPLPASPALSWNSADQRVGPSVFGPEGHLVVASNNGAVVRVNPQGELVTSWPSASPVCGLAATGTRLATCSVDGRLRLWDWEGRPGESLGDVPHRVHGLRRCGVIPRDGGHRPQTHPLVGGRGRAGSGRPGRQARGRRGREGVRRHREQHGRGGDLGTGKAVTEVEIIWPATLAQDRLGDAADELSAAGIETTCRIQPVRRGAETAVLVLMTTTALEPILQATFGRLGESATNALKRFVAKLFGRDSPQPVASTARRSRRGDLRVHGHRRPVPVHRRSPRRGVRASAVLGRRRPSRAAGCGTPARATGSGSRAPPARKGATCLIRPTRRPTTKDGEARRARSGARRSRQPRPSLPPPVTNDRRFLASSTEPPPPSPQQPQQFFGAQHAPVPPPPPRAAPPPEHPQLPGALDHLHGAVLSPVRHRRHRLRHPGQRQAGRPRPGRREERLGQGQALVDHRHRGRRRLLDLHRDLLRRHLQRLTEAPDLSHREPLLLTDTCVNAYMEE